MLSLELIPRFYMPEVMLAFGFVMSLLHGAIMRKPETAEDGIFFCISMLLVAAILAALTPPFPVTEANSLLLNSQFTGLIKSIVFIASAVVLVVAKPYFKHEGGMRFEIGSLFLAASLGMGILISANDLLTLYMGIEVLSLSSYVLAAIKRNSANSAEAGLKYFVLGALASGILLFGISLTYGFAGSTNFEIIAERASTFEGLGLSAGLVFMLAGLAFKIAAVPFHMWTPDVYQGAATPVTTFFATAPKVAVMALLMRVLTGPFHSLQSDWQPIIVLLAIASMVWGALGALRQVDFKRLLAYSSIGHMGYALAGVAAGTGMAMEAVTLYLLIYLVTLLGTFAAVLSMRRNRVEIEDISQLSGMWRTNPEFAATLSVFMFSLAGIPWMAGFFGKFYVFSAVLDANLITLAIVGMLSSVIAAYYYLRIIKIMYFDEPTGEFDRVGWECRWTMRSSGILVFGFFLVPSIALDISSVAGQLAGG